MRGPSDLSRRLLPGALTLLAVTSCASDPSAGPSADPTSSGSPTPARVGSPSPAATGSSAVASTGTVGSAPSPTSSAGTSPSAAARALAAPVARKNPGWALDRLDQARRPLDARFTARSQGRGVTVYVVDGLFDTTHPDLAGRATVGLRNGRHCVLESGLDHGLFVAGIVAGRRTGVAPQARVVSVGAFAGCEGGSDDTSEAQRVARIVRALNWVATHARRPAVANLSLNVDAPALVAGVRRVVAAGVTVVAAAGNSGGDACRFPPAGLPSVLTVTASTRGDRDAGLDHGRCVDLFAPGDSVRSLAPTDLVPGGVARADGAATSWAAPYATGVAALFLSTHPRATPARVRGWMIAHATTGVVRGPLRGSPDRLLSTGGL